MRKLGGSLLAGFVVLGSASALRIESWQHGQAPLGADGGLAPLMVESEALQASIKAENLLARANNLYEIAKLGQEEYEHPTRVIGSAGKFLLTTVA